MSPIIVSSAIVQRTLTPLQAAGALQKECVVLWLGRREGNSIRIMEAIVPVHKAASDQFVIPRTSILSLVETVGSRGMQIVAQVHSHPREAFHSQVDDDWAIVRHVGALSLVLPWFARKTTPETFFKHAVVFSLSPQNTWDHLSPSEASLAIRVET